MFYKYSIRKGSPRIGSMVQYVWKQTYKVSSGIFRKKREEAYQQLQYIRKQTNIKIRSSGYKSQRNRIQLEEWELESRGKDVQYMV